MHVSGNNANSKIDPKLWTVKSKDNKRVIPDTSVKKSNRLRLPTTESARKVLNPIKFIIGGAVGFAGGWLMQVGQGFKTGGDKVYARKDIAVEGGGTRKETFREHFARELTEKPLVIVIKPFVALFRATIGGLINIGPNINTDSKAYKYFKIGAKRLETTKEEKIKKYEDKIEEKTKELLNKRDKETNTEQFNRILKSPIKTRKKKEIQFQPFDRKKQNNYYDHVYGSKPRWNGEKIIGIMDATTKNEARKMLDDGPAIFNLEETENTDLKTELNNIVDPNNGKTDEEAMEDLKGALNKYHGMLTDKVKDMVEGKSTTDVAINYNEKAENYHNEVEGTAVILDKGSNVSEDATNPAFVKLTRFNVIKRLKERFKDEENVIFQRDKNNEMTCKNRLERLDKNWNDEFTQKWNDELKDLSKDLSNDMIESLKCEKGSPREANNKNYFHCELSILNMLIEEQENIVKYDLQEGINDKTLDEIGEKYIKKSKSQVGSNRAERHVKRLKTAVTTDNNLDQTMNPEDVRNFLLQQESKKPTLTLSEKKEVENVKKKYSHSEGLKLEQQILDTKREELNNRFQNL